MGAAVSTLTSRCISRVTEWLQVLLALSGRSCSPCRHTGETPRRHGRPTARGSVHPPGVGEQQRLGSWWACLDNPLAIVRRKAMGVTDWASRYIQPPCRGRTAEACQRPAKSAAASAAHLRKGLGQGGCLGHEAQPHQHMLQLLLAQHPLQEQQGSGWVLG